MLLLILMLTCLTFSHVRANLQECTGIVIRNVMYTKELLVENVNSPYQLALDRETNTLFFSESTDYRQKEVFKTSYVHLPTNEYGSISGVQGGFANVVDNTNHVVYIGSRNGIYTYDRNKKNVNYIAAHGQNVWQMFYKNKLYYTTYPEEKAYVLDDVPSIISALNTTNVMLIALDNNMNIYFSNSSGLFWIKNNEDRIMQIGDSSYNLNSFTTDVGGDLYFSTPSGIYSIDKMNTINLLITFENIYGFVIENDGNFIYAEEDRLFRLRSTKLACVNQDENDLPLDNETILSN